MFPPKREGYSDLRRVHFEKTDSEDSEGSGGTQYEPQQYEPPHRDHRRWWVGYTLFILLGISIFINGVQYVNKLLDATKHTPHDINDVCAMHTFEYPSPIQQDVKVEWRTTKFNDSFLEQSGYRGPPGPETDQLWFDLGTRNRHYIVPEDEGHKYGLNPGHAKIDPKYGGGYPVLFQFEHDLHCLNFMRQSLWWNYEYYSEKGEGPFSNPPEVVEKHVGHCMDMLRQAIMCKPDLQVFGQYWIGDIHTPFVDFNTNHKCLNFWELKNWVSDHQMTPEMSVLKAVVQRPGDTVLAHIP